MRWVQVAESLVGLARFAGNGSCDATEVLDADPAKSLASSVNMHLQPLIES